jgi:hypothetical protein
VSSNLAAPTIFQKAHTRYGGLATGGSLYAVFLGHGLSHPQEFCAAAPMLAAPRKGVRPLHRWDEKNLLNRMEY